jgi:NAD(P)-dependent dehydrogenase (short-subunit alcohol dehydrogenase family)
MSSSTVRNYLITGGARGIGRGLSRLLLSSGHRVFILDHNTEELEHMTTKLSETYTQGCEFEAVSCDLRKPSEISSAVEHVRKLYDGHLDVLINNAALTSGVGAANVANMPLDLWTATLETNLTAPMLMSKLCVPMLAKSPSRPVGGSIVHISSTRAVMSEADNEAYSTTKAGLLGLSQSMAVSLAPRGVRVNAILPGWIHVENECKEADEQGRKWGDGLSEADQAWQLTGRVGKVEDMMKAVQYLSENDGVSGTEMVVDGGVTRKMVYPEE